MRTVFLAWSLLFFGHGLYALVFAAIPAKTNPIKANQQMSQLMRPGALVMAPFDFVYMQQGKFTIQSWCGAERLAGAQKSTSYLEHYADSLGVDYLVADELAIETWGIQESNITAAFSRYQLVLAVPLQHRYLFGKSDAAIRED